MSSGWRPALVKNATTDRASVLSSSAMARESRSGAAEVWGVGGGASSAWRGSRGGKHGTRRVSTSFVRLKVSEEESRSLRRREARGAPGARNSSRSLAPIHATRCLCAQHAAASNSAVSGPSSWCLSQWKEARRSK